jgi:hypothetical protein
MVSRASGFGGGGGGGILEGVVVGVAVVAGLKVLVPQSSSLNM